MNRVIIFSSLILILILSIASFFLMNNAKEKVTLMKKTSIQPSKTSSMTESFTPFTATFSIYTNSVKRDFSSQKYHNRSDAVYITAENPEIVHVTKENITWQDFFDSLPSPMKVSSSCLTTGTGQNLCTNMKSKLSFYRNNKNVSFLLAEEIKPNDIISIRYESQTEDDAVLGAKTSATASADDLKIMKIDDR